MNVLGRDRKGHANTKQAEGARMQDAAKLAAIEAGKIDCNFRPEMGVAAIDHQPIAIPHRRLYIQRQMQRMNSPTKFGLAGLCINIGNHLCHPFGAALAVEIKPVAWQGKVSTLAKGNHRLQKGPRVGQQGKIGGPIEINLLMRTVDAEQINALREQRRVAEIHLVVETGPHHQHKISLGKSVF